MPASDLMQRIERIHARQCPLVMAVTGGGSQAIATLLRVPGASRTVLEAGVYYAAESLADWLGSPPEQFCSARTGRAMAMVAFQRARWLTSRRQPRPAVVGLGCTASLASDRPKKGEHRAHVAWQTRETTFAAEIVLRKALRSRAEEEDLVAHLLLLLIEMATQPATNRTFSAADQTEAAALLRRQLSLAADERLAVARQDAPADWQAVLTGESTVVGRGPQAMAAPASRPRSIFPGAFNPRHEGHLAMAAVARRRFNRPVEYELSVTNVDKPPLDYIEMAQRSAQFGTDETLWFTRAPTFVEKSRIFPGCTFIVGTDTLARIGEPRYYEGRSATAQAASRDEALATMAALGCRFLVFGRRREAQFDSLETIVVPPALRVLCDGVPESEFRADISSTELRRAKLQEPSV